MKNLGSGNKVPPFLFGPCFFSLRKIWLLVSSCRSPLQWKGATSPANSEPLPLAWESRFFYTYARVRGLVNSVCPDSNGAEFSATTLPWWSPQALAIPLVLWFDKRASDSLRSNRFSLRHQFGHSQYWLHTRMC